MQQMTVTCVARGVERPARPTNYYYYLVLRAICCQPVDGSLICFI